jgi:hypothetical protein
VAEECLWWEVEVPHWSDWFPLPAFRDRHSPPGLGHEAGSRVTALWRHPPIVAGGPRPRHRWSGTPAVHIIGNVLSPVRQLPTMRFSRPSKPYSTSPRQFSTLLDRLGSRRRGLHGHRAERANPWARVYRDAPSLRTASSFQTSTSPRAASSGEANDVGNGNALSHGFWHGQVVYDLSRTSYR